MYLLITLLLFLLQVREEEATSCASTNNTGVSKPLYLLTLVPFHENKHNEDLEVLSEALVARDEINNHSDLLPGYHIELIVENTEDCSSTETAIGLANLVKYTVSPPCHPVVAVAGLLCSSHTSVLSPVAGHDGYDLIQLSAANSPIFQTQNHRFSHLWRFLGSATVYSDTVLAIMDQYNWTRIGVVYNTQSVYCRHAVEHLVKTVSSNNKTVVFTIGVNTTLSAVLSTIRRKPIVVVVTILNTQQSIALQSIVHDKALESQSQQGNFTWIHMATTQQLHIQQPSDQFSMYKCKRGCFILDMKSSAFNKNGKNRQNTFSLVLRDQVWAFALALNKSLPVLKTRNLSIDSYSLGQPEITAVIEKQLKNLKFQGISGLIEFNRYRSVPKPVEVLWAFNNETIKIVGLYNPLNRTNFHVNIKPSNLPDDREPKTMKMPNFYVSLQVAVLLYMLTGIVAMFTTVQLILYFHNRHHKEIKATSPCLSSLIFLGSYLICLSSVIIITNVAFVVPCRIMIILYSIQIFMIVNGIGLIFVTLFVKLLRIYRIFTKWMKKDLGRYWSDIHLLLAVTFLTIVPNILAVALVGIFVGYTDYICDLHKEGDLAGLFTRIGSLSFYLPIGLAATYVVFFLLLLLYLGTLNRKIRYKNFNYTCQIYFLIAVGVVSLSLTITIYILYYIRTKVNYAESILTIGVLIFDTICQLILFLPKIVHVVREKRSQHHQVTNQTSSSYHLWTSY